MKPKKSFISSLVFLLTVVSVAAGQILPEQPVEFCGTKITPEQKRAELLRSAKGYATLSPQLNRPYQIPLTIHIVRRNDGTGGLTNEQLTAQMQGLNQLWLPLGVQFYQRGEIDYINNTTLLNIPNNRADRDNLRRVNPVADTVNVHFTNLAGFCGESTFTTTNPQGVLMSLTCGGVTTNPSIFAHEMGHYLDLFHTHETNFGIECPNGSNCADAGDRICDTPADPNMNFTNVTTACVWTGTATPPTSCGKQAYAPPTQNIMSYSRETCLTEFTTAQINKALNVLTTVANRTNLINTLTKYVAPDGNLTSDCTYETPCRTVSRAVQVANPGDTIFLLSDSYSVAAAPISKAVTIRKWNTDSGVVTLTP